MATTPDDGYRGRCDVCGSQTNLGKHVMLGDSGGQARCLCGDCRRRYLAYMLDYYAKVKTYEVARARGTL